MGNLVAGEEKAAGSGQLAEAKGFVVGIAAVQKLNRGAQAIGFNGDGSPVGHEVHPGVGISRNGSARKCDEKGAGRSDIGAAIEKCPVVGGNLDDVG